MTQSSEPSSPPPSSPPSSSAAPGAPAAGASTTAADRPAAPRFGPRANAALAGAALAVLLGCILVIAVDRAPRPAPPRATAALQASTPPVLDPIACPPEWKAKGATCWRAR